MLARRWSQAVFGNLYFELHVREVESSLRCVCQQGLDPSRISCPHDASRLQRCQHLRCCRGSPLIFEDEVRIRGHLCEIGTLVVVFYLIVACGECMTCCGPFDERQLRSMVTCGYDVVLYDLAHTSTPTCCQGKIFLNSPCTVL